MSELLDRSLGELIRLETVLAAGLWRVRADPAQLESAVLNLAVNARDAMPRGGKLTIETSNSSIDEKYAHEYALSAGQYVLVAVTDNGVGIANDVLGRVFDPFFTTKEVGKGTGLGLSMVYGFIRQSNGHIEIASEVGRGTTVRMYFPRSDPATAAAQAPRRQAMPRGSERILVVEDEKAVRAIVGEQLGSLGYDVKLAKDADQALEFLKAQGFDLVLTDVVMPGRLNGRALAEKVKQAWPDTRIVFMSGYSENALLRDGRLESGVMLLAKPHVKADLAKIVRDALGGSGHNRFSSAVHGQA